MLYLTLMASAAVVAQTPAELLRKHRDTLEQRVMRDHGWSRETYDLELMAHWDHKRVAIVVANTNTHMIDFAPTFAVLRDHRIWEPRQKEALGHIIAQAFPKPRAKDAFAIARLATMFGHFGDTVGRVIHRLPKLPAGVTPPRKDAIVAFTKRGAAAVISFYSQDPELMTVYDCQVHIDEGKIRLRANPLTAR